MSKNAEIKPFGQHAFLIEWSDEISLYNHEEVTKINAIIIERFANFMIETVPAYQSLAIYLKKDIDTSYFIESVSQILNESPATIDRPEREIHIPVCYDTEFGMDLEQMSELHDLSIKSIIAHHTKRLYPVYFIGFLPGFPYLEGLNPMISTPRKEKPRSIVKAGSVGIAGDQTGIYPIDSPGGWNIIGRSPISFFDVEKEKPAFLKAGDFIRFFSVSMSEYDKIKQAVENNTYKIKISTKDD
jgi:inhibitor of KinA